MGANSPRFWKINPGGKHKTEYRNWNEWVKENIIAIGTWGGDEYIDCNLYETYEDEEKFTEETGIKREDEIALGNSDRYVQVRRFAWVLKKDDILIPYEKGGKIPGIGKVSTDISDRYEDYLDTYGDHIRDAEWIEFKEPINIKNIQSVSKVMATNNSIRPLDDIKNEIIDLIKNVYPDELSKILSTGGYASHEGTKIGDLLNKKSQVIFYGPPGTGKTYKAREFAVNFIKGGD